jgi:sec-independent protein translocase protein TatA
MPGIHWQELLALFGVALLIFGPKKLPEMGSAFGKTIREFQRSIREIKEPPPATLPAASAPAPAIRQPPNATGVATVVTTDQATPVASAETASTAPDAATRA